MFKIVLETSTRSDITVVTHEELLRLTDTDYEMFGDSKVRTAVDLKSVTWTRKFFDDV